MNHPPQVSANSPVSSGRRDTHSPVCGHCRRSISQPCPKSQETPALVQQLCHDGCPSPSLLSVPQPARSPVLWKVLSRRAGWYFSIWAKRVSGLWWPWWVGGLTGRDYEQATGLSFRKAASSLRSDLASGRLVACSWSVWSSSLQMVQLSRLRE